MHLSEKSPQLFHASLCSIQVLGGSVDGTVRQFDVRMGMMFTDTLHEAVTGIAVSHDGNCVLASCLDNSMRLLDKASGEQLASYTGVIGAKFPLE